MKLAIGGAYDLRPFITAVAGDIDGRCAYCYRVRPQPLLFQNPNRVSHVH